MAPFKVAAILDLLKIKNNNKTVKHSCCTLEYDIMERSPSLCQSSNLFASMKSPENTFSFKALPWGTKWRHISCP